MPLLMGCAMAGNVPCSATSPLTCAVRERVLVMYCPTPRLAGALRESGVPFQLVPVREANVLRVVGILRADTLDHAAAVKAAEAGTSKFPEYTDADGNVYQLIFRGKVHMMTALTRAVKAVESWLGVAPSAKGGKAVAKRGALSSGRSGAGRAASSSKRVPLRQRIATVNEDKPLKSEKPKARAKATVKTKDVVSASGRKIETFPLDTGCGAGAADACCAGDDVCCPDDRGGDMPDALSSACGDSVGDESVELVDDKPLSETARFEFTGTME